MGRRSMLDSILNRPSQSYSAPDPNGLVPSRSKTPRGWQPPSDLPNAPNAPRWIFSGSMFSQGSDGTLGRIMGASVGGSVGGGSLRFGRKKKTRNNDDGASSIVPPSTAADSITGERRRNRWWEGSLRGVGKTGGSRAPSTTWDSIFSEAAEAPFVHAGGWAGIGVGATDTRRRYGTFSGYGEPSDGRTRMASLSPAPPLPQHDIHALRAMSSQDVPPQCGRLPMQSVAPLGQQETALGRARSLGPASRSGSLGQATGRRNSTRLATSSTPDLQAQTEKKRQASKGQEASQDWSAFISGVNAPQNVNGRVQTFAAAASTSSREETKVQRQRSAAEKVRRELEQDALADQANRERGVIHQDLLARAAAQVIGQSTPPLSASDAVEYQGMPAYAGLRPGSVIGEADQAQRPTSGLSISNPPAQRIAAPVQALDHSAMAVQQHAAVLHAVAPSDGSVHALALQQHVSSHAQTLSQFASEPAEDPQTSAVNDPLRPNSAASQNRDLPAPPSGHHGSEEVSESSEKAESATESEDRDDAPARQAPLLEALVEEDKDSSSAGAHEMRPRSPPDAIPRLSAFAAALKKSNVTGTNVAAEVNQQATSVTPTISVDDVGSHAQRAEPRHSIESARDQTDSDNDESLSKEGPVTLGPMTSSVSSESIAPSLPPKPVVTRDNQAASSPLSDGEIKPDAGVEELDETDSEVASRASSSRSGAASRVSSLKPDTLHERLSDMSLGASFAISNMLRGSRAPSQASSSRRMRTRDDDSDSGGEHSEDDAEFRAKAQLELKRLRSIKVGDDFFGDTLTGILDTFDRKNWSDTTIDRQGLDTGAKQPEAVRSSSAIRSSLLQTQSNDSTAESSVHERLLQIRQQRAELGRTAGDDAIETKSLESGIAPSFAAAWLLIQAANHKSVRCRADLLISAKAVHARHASAANAGTMDSISSSAEQYKSLFAGGTWQAEANSIAAPPPLVSVLDRPRQRGAKPSDIGGVEIRQGRPEADMSAKASPPPEDTRSTLPASLSAALLKTPPREDALADYTAVNESTSSSTPGDTKSKDIPAPAKSALKPKPAKSLADTLFSFGSPGKEQKREKKSRKGSASKATVAGDATIQDYSQREDGPDNPKALPSPWAKKERKIAKAGPSALRKPLLAPDAGDTPGAGAGKKTADQQAASHQPQAPFHQELCPQLSLQRPEAPRRLSGGLASPTGSSTTDSFEPASEFATLNAHGDESLGKLRQRGSAAEDVRRDDALSTRSVSHQSISPACRLDASRRAGVSSTTRRVAEPCVGAAIHHCP